MTSTSSNGYLAHVFGAYYEHLSVESLKPPSALQREWGVVPFNGSMNRHNHLNTVLKEFLDGSPPQHLYFSAARYVHPTATPMGEKDWRGADLVFDLDGDHLPEVSDSTPHAELLAACKEELRDLLVLLEDDLGFEDLQVVFSGGRGYHVHVRDAHVQDLSSEERRMIVDYVTGDIAPETVIERERVTASESGAEAPTERRVIGTEGEWGERVQVRVEAISDAVQAGHQKRAVQALTALDGVDVDEAIEAVKRIDKYPDEFKAGNIDIHPVTFRIGKKLVEHTIGETSALIDAPVTTDVHRLIRAPLSLHGGTGLKVQPIDRSAVASFDPLTDAVPDWGACTSLSDEVTIEYTVDESVAPVSVDGFSVDPVSGQRESVPIGAGVYAMCRGWAEKV